MKSPISSVKGQYAVPIVLLGTAALFVIYLLLVYPSERAKLLGSDEFFTDEEEIVESPLGGDTVLIFSSGEIAEVGRSLGQVVVGPYKLVDALTVEYPAVPKTIDSVDGVEMKSSIFTSDVQQFAANNLNLDNTKDVTVHFKVSAVKGSPRILVYLNDTKIYEKTAAVGEYNIKIQPKLLLEDSNPILVKVEGGDLLGNSVKFEKISIDQYYYDISNAVSPAYRLNLQANQFKGNTVHITFKVLDAIADGELMLKIGAPGITKKIVWSGSPDINSTVVASFPLEGNFVLGDNEIVFEAEQNGAYQIQNVSLTFISDVALPANKVYSFNVPAENLYQDDRILLRIKLDRIIEPGYLFFKISPSQTSYYFPTEDLASGAWSYVTIDKSKLKELGDKVTVDSVNGRFRVNGFVIIADPV
jgi:hypothetical protein